MGKEHEPDATELPPEVRRLSFLLGAIACAGFLLPFCGFPELGLALFATGGASLFLLRRMHRCMVHGGALISNEDVVKVARVGAVVLCIVAFFSWFSVPRLTRSRGPNTNESAAIATLKNIISAQAQLQASGFIDTDGDGVGEFGFFAELAGGVAVRSKDARLTPPVLSGAFACVAPQTGTTGGVITRSGYHFQLYLPDGQGRGVPEADMGGVGRLTPDPDGAERAWCCYAWPSSFGASGKRAFFVDQRGDVLATKNLVRRYDGAQRVPRADAAFQVRSLGRLGSSIAANDSGVDGQIWIVVN